MRRTRTIACLAALGILPGCYRNVVGASGPGSERYEIQEANVQDGESVWSQPQPKVREPDRYSGGSVSRAKPVPGTSAPKKPD